MRFRINSNGNDANDMKARLMAVHAAGRALETALQEAGEVFHGRNYQTVGEWLSARDADMEELHQHLLHVRKLNLWAVGGAARVIRQREGV